MFVVFFLTSNLLLQNFLCSFSYTSFSASSIILLVSYFKTPSSISSAHISPLYKATGLIKVSNNLLNKGGGGEQKENEFCNLKRTLVAFWQRSVR